MGGTLQKVTVERSSNSSTRSLTSARDEESGIDQTGSCPPIPSDLPRGI
jgi:hypothetical protein